MSVLALNGGSSSVKMAVFDDDRRVASASVERVTDHAAAVEELLASIDKPSLVAVGHRIVHGGPRFDRALLLDAAALSELRGLSALDPTHLPAELAIIEAARRALPSLPQVACFDTAFHRDLPLVARQLPIPRRYFAAGVRRYGFHGLSFTYLMEELGRLGCAGGRIILAHLGNGSSLSAVRDGKCVDTTMAFTPASGVMMGTRTGDLDPGVLVHLLRTENVDSLDRMINRESGLLGVSEISSDMRDLLASDDPRAAEAVALYCQGVKKAIGALAAVLGGVDLLVFTGGIGEHAAPVREHICAGLEHLGFAVRVLHTDEESMIARQTLAVVKAI